MRRVWQGPKGGVQAPSVRVFRVGVLLLLLLVGGGSSQTVVARNGARPVAPTSQTATITDVLQSAATAGMVNANVASHELAGLAPARLIIPKLHLDAPILSLGPTPSGAMQAPQRGGPTDPVWSEVYWWNPGPEPGQIGNAVIAGHVNRPDGSPSTFTSLNRLVPGDMLQVVTLSGQTLRFQVRAKDAPLVYVRAANDPTIGRIFGPASTPNLNLMTCWGTWDGSEYNRRLVVYSTLVGPSPFPTSA